MVVCNDVLQGPVVRPKQNHLRYFEVASGTSQNNLSSIFPCFFQLAIPRLYPFEDNQAVPIRVADYEFAIAPMVDLWFGSSFDLLRHEMIIKGVDMIHAEVGENIGTT